MIRRVHDPVLGLADAAISLCCRKSLVHVQQVIRIDEAPDFFDGLGWRRMSMMLPDAHIAPEATGGDVRAERAKLGPIEGELQPLVAILECGFMPAHLRKQRRKDERAQRGSQHADLGGQYAVLDRDARIAEKADAEARHPDDGEGNDGCCRGRVYRRAASRKPQQERKQHRFRQHRCPQARWQGQRLWRSSQPR